METYIEKSHTKFKVNWLSRPLEIIKSFLKKVASRKTRLKFLVKLPV